MAILNPKCERCGKRFERIFQHFDGYYCNPCVVARAGDKVLMRQLMQNKARKTEQGRVATREKTMKKARKQASKEQYGSIWGAISQIGVGLFMLAMSLLIGLYLLSFFLK